MKKILTLFILSCASLMVSAQHFDQNLSTARSAYASGNLEEARFAMQQMLTDIDMILGREILKILPTQMGSLPANTQRDNVTANSGFSGVIVHRDYGSGSKTHSLELISNSPLIASVNAFLSIPFIANAGDGSQKVVRVSGYKGMLQRSVNEQTNTTDYTLQLPVGNTLLSFSAQDVTEDQVMKMANTINVSEITKLAQ